MQLSRRDFLMAAAGLVTAGCAVQPGADSGSQTITPTDTRSAPLLDPNLRLSLPKRAVAGSTVEQFAASTGVHVTRVHQPAGPQFLLNLAAGQQGSLDVALVDDDTLRYLLATNLVEPIDRALVPYRRLISAPFNDPPYDRAGAHSIGKDYTVIGYATTATELVDPPGSWKALFQYAAANPGKVGVPDDSEVMVGAAMLSLGHPWSSSNASDLDDARALLVSLRRSLVVAGRLDRRALGDHAAVIASGVGFRKPSIGVHFVVPTEGSVIHMRSYCVLALAPDPVTAHAWLNATLDPKTVKADVEVSRLASPIGAADYLIPPSLMGNPAIYPPSELADVLTFSTTTDAGGAARADLWDAVKA